MALKNSGDVVRLDLIRGDAFDADGRMVANEFARYGWDAASRVGSVTQLLWAAASNAGPSGQDHGRGQGLALQQLPVTWAVGYDSRNRVTSFARTGSQTRYSYDANSNRLSVAETAGGDLDLEGFFGGHPSRLQSESRQLNIDPASNRLLGFVQTVTVQDQGRSPSAIRIPVAYTLDANGALTSDGLRSFGYDASNRLATVRLPKGRDGDEATVVRYLHNGLGQRVFKSEQEAERTEPSEQELGEGFMAWLRRSFGAWLAGAGRERTRLGQAFVYGDDQLPVWALLGEYDNGTAQGKGRTEYIWLPTEDGGAIPVGMYRGGRLYAIHSDHLGTPRLVTDAANKPVWQWPYSAFGDNQPTGVLRSKREEGGSPRIARTEPGVELNLRFPGQYADAETGTFYNYFRDYDAAQGRYIQSDPIGLAGGINTYGYVGGNPLIGVDPRGLMGQGSGGLARSGSKVLLPPVDDPCVMRWINEHYGDILGFITDIGNLQMYFPSANPGYEDTLKEGAQVVAEKTAATKGPGVAGRALTRAIPGSLAVGNVVGSVLSTFGGLASGVVEVAGAFMTPFATTAMAQAREACSCQK